MRVLIVEDEPHLAEAVRTTISALRAPLGRPRLVATVPGVGPGPVPAWAPPAPAAPVDRRPGL